MTPADTLLVSTAEKSSLSERVRRIAASAMRHTLRAVDAVNSVVKYALAAFLTLMVAAAFAQVVIRFALPVLGINVVAAWTEEIARFGMIWVVFVGAGWALRRGELIALDFIPMTVSRRLGILVKATAYFVCIAFSVLLVVIGLDFAEMGHIETSPAMGLPKYWVFLALPVGAALMCVNVMAYLAECLTLGRDLRFGTDPALD